MSLCQQGAANFNLTNCRWEFIFQICISASGSCANVAAYISEQVRVSAPCFLNSAYQHLDRKVKHVMVDCAHICTGSIPLLTFCTARRNHGEIQYNERIKEWAYPKRMKENDEEGSVIEGKLCAMKGGREKIIPAAGVKVNREVGQEPGRSRRLKMFFFPFHESNSTRHQISVGESSCFKWWCVVFSQWSDMFNVLVQTQQKMHISVWISVNILIKWFAHQHRYTLRTSSVRHLTVRDVGGKKKHSTWERSRCTVCVTHEPKSKLWSHQGFFWCLSIHPSIRPSVYPSIRRSIHPSTACGL